MMCLIRSVTLGHFFDSERFVASLAQRNEPEDGGRRVLVDRWKIITRRGKKRNGAVMVGCRLECHWRGLGRIERWRRSFTHRSYAGQRSGLLDNRVVVRVHSAPTHRVHMALRDVVEREVLHGQMTAR